MSFDETPFDLAIENDNKEIVEMLLAHKANVDFGKYFKASIEMYKILFKEKGYEIIPSDKK
mgnify:CR=1 FL=1